MATMLKWPCKFLQLFIVSSFCSRTVTPKCFLLMNSGCKRKGEQKRRQEEEGRVKERRKVDEREE